mgnify:FL=1
MIATAEDIEAIIPNAPDNIKALWLLSGSALYFTYGERYGLICTIEDPYDVTYIASTVIDPAQPFTVSMLRFIKTLHDEGKICLITDHPRYHELIQSVLSRYNMRYEVQGDTMYSYNF